MIELRGRLSGGQWVKILTLFDMMYTPSELASEIGFTTRQIYRVYIPLGCPCVRNKGRLYINGVVFRDWYNSIYYRVSMRQNQAFCLTCKAPVIMQNPVEHVKGRLRYWVCNCSVCGRKLSRIVDCDKS